MVVESATRTELRRRGQFIKVEPPCRELDCLRTSHHIAASDSSGRCQIARRPESLFKDFAESWHPPYRQMLAGLEPCVIQLLQNAGHQVRVCGDSPASFPEPRFDSSHRHRLHDAAVLGFVHQHPRGIIQFDHTAVNQFHLIGQIVAAFPRLKIAVLASQQKLVKALGRSLLAWSANVSTVYGGHIPAQIERVVVSTLASSGHPHVGLNHCDLVLMFDAQNGISDEGLQAVRFASKARVFGFKPYGCQVSPRDADWQRAVYGFCELSVPSHGHQELPVEVVTVRMQGGPRISAEANHKLKRNGVWQQPVRNRRIIRLAGLLASGDRLQLTAQFAEVARHARDGDTSVLIVVENLEHAAQLLTGLEDGSLICGDYLDLQGLKPSQQLAVQKARFRPFSRIRVATLAALDCVSISQFNVVLRADAGVGELPITHRQLAVPNNVHRRLLLIDFMDRHRPELRRRSRHRQQAYADRGWFAAGTDPVEARVKEFLAKRNSRG